jgi:NitT/TauT family transport system substrate-binding protein
MMRTVLVLATAAALLSGAARAEVTELRLAQQYGIGYLPLHVVENQKLIQKHAQKAGITITKVSWATFAAGNAMNEAILSGSLDIASGGVGPLLTIWSKTKGRQEVKGVASLNSMPLYLNTNNPNVKSIKDFTDKDKIALPAVKVSIQAVTLQMAAEKAFGAGQHNKLDALTVSMAHPDGMAALISGKTEVTAHLTSPPFQYQELQDQRVRRVLSSYEVLGGPATFNTLWTTKKFRDENPKVYKAFVDALEEAMELIKRDPQKAAEIYVAEEKSKVPVEAILKMIKDPEITFTTAPQNLMKYAEFMNKIGSIEAKPASWKDVFFPEIHGKEGS